MGKKQLRVHCFSVTIQEEGQGLLKSYMDIEAILDNGVLYVDNKYRFRMKQMTELKVADNEINTKFANKGKTSCLSLEASPQSKDWNDFCKRWTAHFEKNQSNERKSGFGGARGSFRGFGRKKENMPWDDDKSRKKLSKTSQPMTQTFQKRSSAVVVSTQKDDRPPVDESLSERNILFASEDVNDNDQEENKDAPMESDDESVPKVIKKKRRIQRKSLFDNDDSDDDIFDSNTTPAASNHAVSPVTGDRKGVFSDDSESDTEFDDSLKNQPQISSYFAPAKASPFSKPDQVQTPKASNSPQPASSARKAIQFSDVRKYGVSQRSLDMLTSTQRKKKRSLDSNSWLLNSQSKKGQSSAEKRRSHLYTSASKELSSDPIEENSIPPLANAPVSPKRWRNTLLADRRRQFGKGAKTFANHRPRSLPGLMDSDEPERPRFRGLRNLGNTCYMNASLQMLFSCPDFMAALQKCSAGDLVKSVCKIYRDLQKPNEMAAKPTLIKDVIDTKTDKFLGFEQRDAHEFLADLIDHMDEEIKGEANEGVEATTLPTDDFSLTVRAHFTCTSCGYTRHKDEMHRGLSVDIVEDPDTGTASIRKSIQQFFAPDCRELKCEKCDNGTHANQSLSIARFPKVLLLHLKRFIFVEAPSLQSIPDNSSTVENQEPNSPAKPAEIEYVFRKNKAPVEFSTCLQLSQYKTAPSGDEGDCAKSLEYSLKSVVRHIGRMASSGHYTADALRTDDHSLSESKGETFVSFDDHSSRRTTVEDVIGKRRETPYMILYMLNP